MLKSILIALGSVALTIAVVFAYLSTQPSTKEVVKWKTKTEYVDKIIEKPVIKEVIKWKTKTVVKWKTKIVDRPVIKWKTRLKVVDRIVPKVIYKERIVNKPVEVIKYVKRNLTDDEITMIVNTCVSKFPKQTKLQLYKIHPGDICPIQNYNARDDGCNMGEILWKGRCRRVVIK